jgi:hypothetical protein
LVHSEDLAFSSHHCEEQSDEAIQEKSRMASALRADRRFLRRDDGC